MNWFILEENRHSQTLKRYLDIYGIKPENTMWIDTIFRMLRKLMGLECEVTILVMAEMITLSYYTAFSNATHSELLKTMCKQMLNDELFVTEGVEYGEDGIAVFIDKYWDVIFTPEGDVKVDDRDELDAAYESGELSKEQYDAALMEDEKILEDLCSDISQTDQWCANIRQIVEDRIADGELVRMCREVLAKRK